MKTNVMKYRKSDLVRVQIILAESNAIMEMDLDSERQNEQGAILHDISTSFTCIVLKGGIIY